MYRIYGKGLVVLREEVWWINIRLMIMVVCWFVFSVGLECWGLGVNEFMFICKVRFFVVFYYCFVGIKLVLGVLYRRMVFVLVGVCFV